MSVKWGPDLAAEAKMKEFGLTWQERVIPMSEIDWEASKANNARMSDPIQNDLVEEYGIAMEQGDVFPKGIVHRRANKKYLILSGNHRGLGAELVGDKSAPWYVVETTDAATLDLLPRVLNRAHGKRQEKEEAMLHALHAIAAYSFSSKKAAELFGLSHSSVLKQVVAKETSEFLQKHGVKPEPIQKGALESIGRIQNDNVKLAIGRLSSTRNLPTGVVESCVRRIKEQRTEASQMAIVAELEKQTEGIDPGPAVKIPRNVRSKILGWLTTGENYFDKPRKLKQFQITADEETKKVKARLKSLAHKLLDLSKS